MHAPEGVTHKFSKNMIAAPPPPTPLNNVRALYLTAVLHTDLRTKNQHFAQFKNKTKIPIFVGVGKERA
jgi:hypothetical protein